MDRDMENKNILPANPEDSVPELKILCQMRCVLKDSSSRARALARQRDTEISRNAFLGISFCFLYPHIRFIALFRLQ